MTALVILTIRLADSLMLRERLGVMKVVIHTLEDAISCDAKSSCRVGGFFVDRPLVTTGAGDNFNGGLCAGLLLDLPPDQQLMLANGAASYYVYSGGSGSIKCILNYLNKRTGEENAI